MMNEMIKKQNFGVEIEMNNMSRGRAQKIVAKVLGSTNTGYESSYDNHYVIDNKGRMWKCESDASISGGTCQATELVTPVLQYDDIETLQEVIRQGYIDNGLDLDYFDDSLARNMIECAGRYAVI